MLALLAPAWVRGSGWNGAKIRLFTNEFVNFVVICIETNYLANLVVNDFDLVGFPTFATVDDKVHDVVREPNQCTTKFTI